MARRYWNINLEEMMEAGIHFGHGTRKWNPRMAPYISAKHKGIHITNLTRTARFLSEACDLVFDAASRGKQFLIVGTKNKAADSVARAAIRARCHYVNKKMARWYVNELGHYGNETSEVQGFENGTKVGETQPPPQKRCSYVEETIITLANVSGRDKIYDGVTRYCNHRWSARRIYGSSRMYHFRNSNNLFNRYKLRPRSRRYFDSSKRRCYSFNPINSKQISIRNLRGSFKLYTKS
uniref:Small ribosomal subunit protein uS2c n=1 Tax=Commiphora gileadensis TaxID=1700993 RepID=A0A410PA61_9ROSI|nr:ribosomal protein S2 [Commiphora gileadensis]QAT19686.1 ribosomal protein S2 [Commiphora gileadensis]